MNNSHAITVAITLIVACALPSVVRAGDVPVHEESPGLLKLATIRPAAAEASALAKIPGGSIRAAEIEKEGGKLIYSFEIKVKGRPGIEEVNVDATNGKVIGVEHEDAATESKEAAADAAKPPR